MYSVSSAHRGIQDLEKEAEAREKQRAAREVREAAGSTPEPTSTESQGNNGGVQADDTGTPGGVESDDDPLPDDAEEGDESGPPEENAGSTYTEEAPAREAPKPSPNAGQRKLELMVKEIDGTSDRLMALHYRLEDLTPDTFWSNPVVRENAGLRRASKRLRPQLEGIVTLLGGAVIWSEQSSSGGKQKSI